MSSLDFFHHLGFFDEFCVDPSNFASIFTSSTVQLLPAVSTHQCPHCRHSWSTCLPWLFFGTTISPLIDMFLPWFNREFTHQGWPAVPGNKPSCVSHNFYATHIHIQAAQNGQAVVAISHWFAGGSHRHEPTTVTAKVSRCVGDMAKIVSLQDVTNTSGGCHQKHADHTLLIPNINHHMRLRLPYVVSFFLSYVSRIILKAGENTWLVIIPYDQVHDSSILTSWLTVTTHYIINQYSPLPVVDR